MALFQEGWTPIELMSHDGRAMALFFVAAVAPSYPPNPWHVITYFFPFPGIENEFVDGHYIALRTSNLQDDAGLNGDERVSSLDIHVRFT